MAECPHCGKEIEIGPHRDLPWWVIDTERKGRNANLGCGTLILIAIIVAVFSGGRGSEHEIQRIQQSVLRVEQAVEALGKELRRDVTAAENAIVPLGQ